MLRFQEYAPAALLRPYVHSFWTLECDANGREAGSVFRFIPDGHPEWLFHLGARTGFRFKSSQQVTHSAAHFLGHFNGHIDLHVPAEGMRLLGVKFWPWAAHHFWQGTMQAYTDAVADLAAATPHHAALAEQLPACTNTQARIALLENFLIQQLKAPISEELLHYFQTLQTADADFRLDALQTHSSVSKRRLQQIFSDKVGLSPKQIHRIYRIRQAVQHMAQQPQESLTQVAYRFHFYDQSHFTREFKAFTGFAPKWFQTHLNPTNGMLNFTVDAA